MSAFSLRPPRDEDLPRLVEIERAHEAERRLESTVDADQILLRWGSPGFDRERHGVVAEVGGVIVASGVIGRTQDSDQSWGGGFVLPAYRGRGIGSALLRWAIDAARAMPGVNEFRTGAPVERPDAGALIESFGFEHNRTWFRMCNRAPASIAAPEFPAGIKIRHLDGDEWIDAFVAGYDGSFIDHFNFHPADREEIAYWVKSDPKFDPALCHFAFDGEELAGMCNTELLTGGSVLRADLGPIGTMRRWRGIGLGRALLRHGTRDLASRGAVEVVLGVDSENPSGAVRLYAGNGYEVTHEVRSYRLAF